MAIFAIADLHLSVGREKPMDIFGGWLDYQARLERSWRGLVQAQDTVVIAGDISWGMSLESSLADFQFLDSLPGQKVLIKGNHDYWWTSKKKMDSFFETNGLSTLRILHNSCVCAEGHALCGTRGWMLGEAQVHDRKLIAREEGRLRTSLEAAKTCAQEPVVFLNYPPVFNNETGAGTLELMRDYGVRRCFYGHLHGAAHTLAFEGEIFGITFALVSADYLRFAPKSL
jgi:predicted phosphohydrolase